ncbi:MAG: MarR family transcriptional regulator [Thermoguttaceae bacterium]
MRHICKRRFFLRWGLRRVRERKSPEKPHNPWHRRDHTPSLSDIARRGGMDRQTASRAVGRLARRKMLQVLRRGGLNQGPSEYRIFPLPMK